MGKTAASLLLELIEKKNSAVLETRFEPYLVNGENLMTSRQSKSKK